MHICMHAHMHACTHACMHLCLEQGSLEAFKGGLVEVDKKMGRACMHVRIHVRMHVCMNVRMHVRMHVEIGETTESHPRGQ